MHDGDRCLCAAHYALEGGRSQAVFEARLVSVLTQGQARVLNGDGDNEIDRHAIGHMASRASKTSPQGAVSVVNVAGARHNRQLQEHFPSWEAALSPFVARAQKQLL